MHWDDKTNVFKNTIVVRKLLTFPLFHWVTFSRKIRIISVLFFSRFCCHWIIIVLWNLICFSAEKKRIKAITHRHIGAGLPHKKRWCGNDAREVIVYFPFVEWRIDAQLLPIPYIMRFIHYRRSNKWLNDDKFKNKHSTCAQQKTLNRK